jgi:hypothetical protein
MEQFLINLSLSLASFSLSRFSLSLSLSLSGPSPLLLWQRPRPPIVEQLLIKLSLSGSEIQDITARAQAIKQKLN